MDHVIPRIKQSRINLDILPYGERGFPPVRRGDQFQDSLPLGVRKEFFDFPGGLKNPAARAESALKNMRVLRFGSVKSVLVLVGSDFGPLKITGHHKIGFFQGAYVLSLIHISEPT